MREPPPRDREPPPRDRPPRRELPRGEGPFDRLLRTRGQRDPAPFIIGGTVGFLAIVILVVLLLSGVFSGGGDGDDGGTFGGSGVEASFGEMPALPPGLVAVSNFVLFRTDGEVSRAIALQLRNEVEDETGLGFYTYRDNRWQRVGDVAVDNDKRLANGEFNPLPANLAVLRVVAQAYQVAASLPTGGRLHPDAGVGILNPRDYKPLSDAGLEGTADEELLVEEGTMVIPTVVGSGQDTAAVVNDLLRDESLRGQHIEELVALVEGGEFAGIDLEYSDVDPELRDEFTSFVEELGSALRDLGTKLSLTLPPPNPQRQAYDWARLGEAADIIKVLPIADPLGYYETMPEALDELVKEVDPKKVMLVVSPFSTERTEGEGGSVSTRGFLESMLLATEIRVREPADPADIKPDTGVRLVAINLAQSEGATDLRWNDDAKALSFSYGGTDQRTVFLENVFSANFKLEIVQVYALGGVAVSDAASTTDVANIWPAVSRLLETGTVSLVRPNGDALVPRWESPDGGQLDAAAGPSVVWRADDEGEYTLRMLISDGDQRFGRELKVDVGAGTKPTPQVTFPAEEPTPTPTPTPAPGATPTPTPSAGDTTPPGKVTGVKVVPLSEGECGLRISWNPSTAPDIASYRVYASTDPDADLDNWEFVPPARNHPTTVTVDTDIEAGVTYYYYVTAVDKSGNESVPSNVDSRDGPGSCPAPD